MRTARLIPLTVLLALLAVCLCGCAAKEEAPAFDPVTEGLVTVQTVHESNGSVKYYALASENRFMETEPFTPDDMRLFTVKDFSIGMDPIPIHAYGDDGNEVPVSRDISTICHALREIGHSVMECRILNVGDEWFASAILNVN